MESRTGKTFDMHEDETKRCGKEKNSELLVAEPSDIKSIIAREDRVCDSVLGSFDEKSVCESPLREGMQQNSSEENTPNSRFCAVDCSQSGSNTNSSNSGSEVEEKTQMEASKMGVQNNRDKNTAVANLYSLSKDPRINTLEDSLNHFGMPTLLEELEKSLEEVKRNKINPQDHELCLKAADKEMQKLSFTFHPDRVSNRGGSDLEVATAQKLQSALNASRAVLKMLTEVFLEDIDIDYRYECFAKLKISSLVNEDAIKREINDVLYKINQISEIKRLKIIGQIRNFLTESQSCVKSYIDRDKKNFKKFRDFALYHLKKCIEGYKELEMECEFLKAECQDETGENIKSVVLKVAKQCSKELSILTTLENVARSSLQGSLQIFTTDEPMDVYFVLPFVHHVNVLLMCNAMLEKKSSWCWPLFSKVPDPHFKEDSTGILFANAYYLASHLKDKNLFKKEIEAMRRKGFSMSTEEYIIKEFDDTLEQIVEILENDFKIDAYKEGKSNRMQFMEKLSKLEKEMADLREEENNLSERIRMREKMFEENWMKYH